MKRRGEKEKRSRVDKSILKINLIINSEFWWNLSKQIVETNKFIIKESVVI